MPLSRHDLGRRIAAAREASGMSQAELGQRIGLNQSAVSRIQSGERNVDSLELAGIAEALGVAVADLLEIRPLANELRVAARGQPIANAGALERAIDRIVGLVRLDEMLEELGLPPEVPLLPDVQAPPSGLAIHQGHFLAERVREAWQLDDDPILDPFGLIEERTRVGALLEPLDGGLDGLFVRTDQASVILVDSSVPPGRQRFTACHELCHFLLREGELLIVDERIFRPGDTLEMRANAFAAHFLMPVAGVRRYLRGRPVDETVVAELKYTFGVSLDSLLWHLLNLDLITSEQRVELSGRGARNLAYRHGYIGEWERDELERDLRRSPGSLVTRALAAYERGLIGVRVIASLLSRDDPERVRAELEAIGIGHDSRWWESTAPA